MFGADWLYCSVFFKRFLSDSTVWINNWLLHPGGLYTLIRNKFNWCTFRTRVSQ